MEKLVFFYPTGHENHSEVHHVECPDRVECIKKAFQEVGLWTAFPFVEPVHIPKSILQTVHTPNYYIQLEAVCDRSGRPDPDTYTKKESWRVAFQTAGGGIALADAVWKKKFLRGFALTRPPGHHALPHRPMGYCLLNNVALATEYLLQVCDTTKVAIIDLDVHHGNGTQEIFWWRKEVLYLSIHQYPLYPWTGFMEDIGAGDGEGSIVNLPVPPRSGNKAYVTLVAKIVLPLLDRFLPEIILISAGFDSHWKDPKSEILLSAQCYGLLIEMLVDWADLNSEGRIAVFLEGGYDLDALSSCGLAVVSALIGRSYEDSLGAAPMDEDDQWLGIFNDARSFWGIN